MSDMYSVWQTHEPARQRVPGFGFKFEVPGFGFGCCLGIGFLFGCTFLFLLFFSGLGTKSTREGVTNIPQHRALTMTSSKALAVFAYGTLRGALAALARDTETQRDRETETQGQRGTET